MKRTFYHHIQNSKRLLSLEEIGNGCSVSLEKIRGWIAADHLRTESSPAHLIDAVKVVAFLIEHSLPISTALLPPQTKRILFITASVDELAEQSGAIEQVCRAFKDRYNVLSEMAVIGRTANLTILASQPDLVVLFLKSYNLVTANLFQLLDNSSLKTLLLVEQKTKDALNHGRFSLPGDMILCEKTPEELLHSQVRTIFDC